MVINLAPSLRLLQHLRIICACGICSRMIVLLIRLSSKPISSRSVCRTDQGANVIIELLENEPTVRFLMVVPAVICALCLPQIYSIFCSYSTLQVLFRPKGLVLASLGTSSFNIVASFSLSTSRSFFLSPLQSRLSRK